MNGSYMGGRVEVYGTLGTPSAATVSGSKQESISWITPKGDLWLFGGYVRTIASEGEQKESLIIANSSSREIK